MDSKLEAARKKLTRQVMGRPGVTGTAIGEAGGDPCLKIYLKDKEAKKGLPSKVDGFRVVTEVTGPFRAL